MMSPIRWAGMMVLVENSSVSSSSTRSEFFKVSNFLVSLLMTSSFSDNSFSNFWTMASNLVMMIFCYLSSFSLTFIFSLRSLIYLCRVRLAS